MKRILSLLLAAALCLALLPVQVLAENTEDPAETGITAPSEEEIVTPPAEDEEAAADLTFAQAFPDANFRTYVTGTVLRSSTDGKADADVITEAQWETIRGTTSVSVSSRGIASLQGIGYFTGASSLNCSYNQLTELDVSQNTALTTLRCNGNQLKTLDLSQNTALTELDCSDNQLSTLDLSQNTALASAYLYGQQLTATEPGVLGDDGNYTVDLKPLLSAGAELDRITLRGSGTYDPVTGTVSLSSVPYQLQYAYATKSPNGDELDVTVEVPHTHAMQEIPAKDATCTEQGTILHWECEICDRCFQDSEGTTQLDSWTAHPRALGHDCSDWETVTEATETENGLQRQSCSRCGAVLEPQQVIPALQPRTDKWLVTSAVTTENIRAAGYENQQKLDVAINAVLTKAGFDAASSTRFFAQVNSTIGILPNDRYPEEGVAGMVKQPEATRNKNCTFYAVQVLTADSHGHNAGDVVVTPLTVTKEGISLTLCTEAVVAIAWKVNE